MMYYLIYKNGEFFGYSDDKDMVYKYLDIIKGDGYTVLPIKEKKLSDSLINGRMEGYNLVYYTGYRTVNKYPLREFELDAIEYVASEMAMDSILLADNILNYLKYIKFSNDEKEIIKIAMSVLIRKLDNIVGIDSESGDEIVYDEFVKIDKMIQLLNEGKSSNKQ